MRFFLDFILSRHHHYLTLGGTLGTFIDTSKFKYVQQKLMLEYNCIEYVQNKLKFISCCFAHSFSSVAFSSRDVGQRSKAT